MQTPRSPVEFGVGGSHEGRHFFVPCLDELDFPVGAVERTEHTIDAVARVAEHVPHIPLMQALDKKVAYGFRHCSPLPNHGAFHDDVALTPFERRITATSQAPCRVHIVEKSALPHRHYTM